MNNIVEWIEDSEVGYAAEKNEGSIVSSSVDALRRAWIGSPPVTLKIDFESSTLVEWTWRHDVNGEDTKWNSLSCCKLNVDGVDVVVDVDGDGEEEDDDDGDRLNNTITKFK